MRGVKGARTLGLLLSSSMLVGGCERGERPATPRAGDEFTPGGPAVDAPLGPVSCEIEVFDVGLVDIETDYLPRVITCENGGAGLEALKAQAIAARSVAYYSIETSGGICDSQGCQVYTCAASPGPLAYEAVEATRGRYLSYDGILTYGFYVAGDSDTAAPACVGTATTGTETWVTYNEGRTGTEVQQTELGFVHDPADPGYGQNRGCMSQWGARCLENSLGYDTDGILRFYYGSDVEQLQATGPCLGDGPGDGDGDGDGDGAGSFEDGSASDEGLTAGGEVGGSDVSTGSASSTVSGGGGSETGDQGSVGSAASEEVGDGAAVDGSAEAGCSCDNARTRPSWTGFLLTLCFFAGSVTRRGLRRRRLLGGRT